MSLMQVLQIGYSDKRCNSYNKKILALNCCIKFEMGMIKNKNLTVVKVLNWKTTSVNVITIN